MTRTWKRYTPAPVAAAVVAVTALCRPELFQQLAFWVGGQFSQLYMGIMMSTVLSDAAFSQLQ